MNNAYICVAVGFPRHKKTLRLQSLIGERAFWIPPFLWAYAAENQRNGNFSDYTGADLARVLGVPEKDGEGIKEALQKVKFLTPKGCVNDWKFWNSFYGNPEQKKAAAAKRWAEIEVVYKANGLTREAWFEKPKSERQFLVTAHRAKVKADAAAPPAPGHTLDNHTAPPPAPTKAAPAGREPTPGQMMTMRERKKALVELISNHKGNPKSRAYEASDTLSASEFRMMKKDVELLTAKMAGKP